MNLLIIYDTDGWAFWRRACALKKYAPDHWRVTAQHFKVGDFPAERYDVVFCLDPTLLQWCRQNMQRHRTGALLVGSYNNARMWKLKWDAATEIADWCVVNSYTWWDSQGRPAGTCNISNGVDRSIFRPIGNPLNRMDEKAVWTASSSKSREKNYKSVLLPAKKLAREHGFKFDLRPLDKPKHGMTTEELVKWYNSATYVLCASSAEGTPNYLTEAVSCGCIPVTTAVGNTSEWGEHGQNCVFVAPDARALVDGLLYAQNHRKALTRNVLRTMTSWDWSRRAKYFFWLFERLLHEGAAKIDPWTYREVDLACAQKIGQ